MNYTNSAQHSVVALALVLGLHALPTRAQEGAYAHNYAIRVPPGVQGVEPQLSLSYNSDSGNGLLGVGWMLTGLPVITRVHGTTQVAYTSADSLAHAGFGEIVQQPDGTYRTKTESFVRFRPSASNDCGQGPCYWVVTLPTGVTEYYGGHPAGGTDSRLSAHSSSTVKTWALSRVVDLHGNYYDVAYAADLAGGVLYPSSITYTKGPQSTAFRTVTFEYEGRTDTEPGYYQSDYQEIAQRLRYITIKSNGSLVRRYQLNYECGSGPGTICSGSITLRSRLKSVVELGADNATQITQLTNTWVGGRAPPKSSTAYALPTEVFASDTQTPDGWRTGVEVVDLNGDGRSDIVRAFSDGGTLVLRAWLNTGSGWVEATNYRPPAAGFERSSSAPKGCDTGVRFIDLNRDGLPDIIQGLNDGATSVRRAWINNGGACTSTGCAWSLTQSYSPPVAFTGRDSTTPSGWNLGTALVDVNGDGFPDLIQSMSDFGSISRGVWLNTGSGWQASASHQVPVAAGFFSYRDNNLRASRLDGLQAVDLNGDGRVDLVFSNDELVPGSAWLNNGSTWVSSPAYAPPVTLRGWMDGFLTSFIPAKFYLYDMGTRWIDINGDGLLDLVQAWTKPGVYDSMGHYYEPVQRYSVHVNTGTGWKLEPYYLPRALAGLHGEETFVRAVDLNGDGKTDFVIGSATGPLEAYIATGSGWQLNTMLTPPVSFQAGLLIFDMDGDGAVDFAQGYRNSGTLTAGAWLRSDSKFADLIASITNGLGKKDSPEFTAENLVAGATRRDSTGPGVPVAGSRPLLTRLALADGNGGTTVVAFSYSDDRMLPGAAGDRRYLGFAAVTATNLGSGLSTVRRYYQTPGLEQQLASVESLSSTGLTTGRATYEYEVATPFQGTTFVRPKTESSTRYELGQAGPTNVITFDEYDAYGNNTLRTYKPAGLDSFSERTDYSNDPANWVLRRVTGRSTRFTKNGVDRLLRASAFTWTNHTVTTRSDWCDTCTTEWIDTTYTYEPSGNLTSIELPATADGLTRITTYHYESAAPYFRVAPSSIENALGQFEHFTYRLDGQIASAEGFNQDVTVYEYDALWRIQSITRPAGGTTVFEFLDVGSPASGDLAHAQRLVIHEATGSGREKKRVRYFDGTGYVYRREDPTGCGPESAPLPAVTLFTKDAAGRDYGQSAPFCGPTQPRFATTVYDVAGRTFIQTAPDSFETIHSYDDRTGLRTRRDARGTLTSQTLDSMGRIVRATDGANAEATYEYDPLGRLLSVTAPGGTSAAFSYNSMGWRNHSESSSGGSWDYTYDSVGNRTFDRALNSPAETTVTRTFDSLNRISSKSAVGLSGPEDAQTFTYDEATHSNGAGRLTTLTDASGVLQFGYTSDGLVSSKVRVMNGVAYPMQWSYDLAGQVQTITYPDSSVATYWYRPDGPLKSVLLDESPIAEWTAYAPNGRPASLILGSAVSTSAFQYDAGEHIQSIITTANAGNIRDVSYDWYANGANGLVLAAVTDHRTDRTLNGVNTDESRDFQYDAAGRLIQATGLFGASASPGGQLDRQLAYANNHLAADTATSGIYFDFAGRLAAKTTAGADWQYYWTVDSQLRSVRRNSQIVASMAYDFEGQRVSRSVQESSGRAAHTVFIDHLFESTTYSDSTTPQWTVHVIAHGEVIASRTRGGWFASASGYQPLGYLLGSTSFLDRLTPGGAFATSVTVACTYLRAEYVGIVLFVIGGTSLLLLLLIVLPHSLGPRTLHRGDRTLRTASALAATGLLCASGCGPAARSSDFMLPQFALSGGTSPATGFVFYHRDQASSPVVLTSESGLVLSRISYDPFGAVSEEHSAGIAAPDFRLGGKHLDVETGLQYFESRYYDPSIGRFLSPDSIIPRAADPQSWNRYSFASNDPVGRIDPSGHADGPVTNEYIVYNSATFWTYGFGPGAALAVSWFASGDYKYTFNYIADGGLKYDFNNFQSNAKDKWKQFTDWLGGLFGHHKKAPAPAVGAAPQTTPATSGGTSTGLPPTGMAPGNTSGNGAPPLQAPFVVAPHSGTVQYIGWQDDDHSKGYGYHLRISTPEGGTVTVGHMVADSVPTTIGLGDSVEAGVTVIGQMGTTGQSTGAHVHVDWRPGGGFGRCSGGNCAAIDWSDEEWALPLGEDSRLYSGYIRNDGKTTHWGYDFLPK